MTRDEAVAEIRQTTRTCRGPMRSVLTPADHAKMSEQLRTTLGALALTGKGRGDAASTKGELLADSRREDAAEFDALLRTGCGADFNNVIGTGPLDGAVHAYQCPRCGVAGIYQAPLYVIEG